MSNNINSIITKSNNNSIHIAYRPTFSPIVFAIDTIKTLNEAIAKEVKRKGSLKSFLKTADLNNLTVDISLMPAISKILRKCDAETAMPLLAAITKKEILNHYSAQVFEALEAFNTSDRLPVFCKALELGRARKEFGENAINYNDLLTRNLPNFVCDAIMTELRFAPFQNAQRKELSQLVELSKETEKKKAELYAAHLQAQIKQNNKKSDVWEIKKAIETGSLNTYLENELPVEIGKKISADLENAPYVEILKICDAKIAMHVLSALCERHILNNKALCFHVIQALEVFNTPDRLPVFIEALKLGRGKHKNNIGVVALRLLNHDLITRFEKGLPSFVLEALEIEYPHLCLSSDEKKDMIDEAELKFAQLITKCSLKRSQ